MLVSVLRVTALLYRHLLSSLTQIRLDVWRLGETPDVQTALGRASVIDIRQLLCSLTSVPVQYCPAITVWSRELHVKLIFHHLLKKSSALCGSRGVITLFTQARHLSLS